MTQLTPIVKNLIIINVLVFACVYLMPMGVLIPDLKLYFPLDKMDFQPYQLVTHMFMHADGEHILFNMLCLFFLGGILEKYIGSKDFLAVYLLSGIGSMLAHIGIQFAEYYSSGYTNFVPALGASGAVYGVLVSFAILFPDLKLGLLFLPIRFKAKYMAMALIAYDFISGVGGFETGTAHFAHLGGGLTGAIITFFWLKQKYRRP